MKEELINELIESELDHVDYQWPEYASHHEAYAVIKEEVEELNSSCESVTNCLNGYWGMVKIDFVEPHSLDALKLQAMNAIKEAVQVYVTAHRAQRLLK